MSPKRIEWKTVPIKELYAGLFDGPHATPKPADDGPVFLGIKNVTDDGRLDLSDIRHISEDDYADWTRRVEPAPGDIVFTYEATLNRYAIIPEGFRGCLGRRMALIRPDPAKMDTRFLHFYFFTEAWRKVIAANTLSGATVDRIPLTNFPDFPVSVPPLPVQRRIAAIFSAYDDLIGNNLRRIGILEEMARALYREWFVEFKFPECDKVPRVASALGLIPKGWATSTLSTLVDTRYGYTESSNSKPVGPKYLRGMDINKTSYIDWSDVPYCPIPSEDIDHYRLRKGDVVVIRMADPGKVGIVEEDVEAVFASYLIRVDPKDNRLSPYFLFHLMDSRAYQNYISGVSTGTTRKSASAGVVTGFDFVLPPKRLVNLFEQRVVPVRQLLTNLLKQNANLRRTRDLLLPRLLSGEVSVAEAALVE